MKADASVRIGARRTIFQVPPYDTAMPGQLASYLVMPSCQKANFHQPISVSMSQSPVPEPCKLGVFAHLVITFINI